MRVKIFLNSGAAILYNHKSSYSFHSLGDRLAAGPGTLTPITEVRILLPQPLKNRSIQAIPAIFLHSFKTACWNAGLKDLRIHDLRHVFASKMVMGGTSLYITGELLGHRTYILSHVLKKHAFFSERI